MRYAMLAVSVVALAVAQTPTRVIGEVTSKDSGGEQLTLRDDSGKATGIVVNDKTTFLRVAPGETNLSKAATIAFSDVAVGDRILATMTAEAGPAARIVVMAKSDIAQKRAAESADWQKRGHAGTITAIDPETNKITITSGPVIPGSGPSTLTVEPGGHTQYRRYAPDSVRFADAQPSTAAALKTGDQLRVLGNREGDTVRAEIVVSGEFRNVAGTVASTDAATGEVRIVDLATKQPIVVKTGSESIMRRFPAQMAEMLARRRSPTSGEQQGSRAASVTPPEGERRTGDMQQMLERMPSFSISELKPGDAVIVTSTAGKEPGRVTAIALLAGVEPLLRADPESSGARVGGNWNFDINIMP